MRVKGACISGPFGAGGGAKTMGRMLSAQVWCHVLTDMIGHREYTIVRCDEYLGCRQEHVGMEVQGIDISGMCMSHGINSQNTGALVVVLPTQKPSLPDASLH